MESVLHCVRLPLLDFQFFLFSGALRLPDGPKKPVALKPVERKPLESVVRYLGRKQFLTSTPSLMFVLWTNAVTWFDGKINTKWKQLFCGMV